MRIKLAQQFFVLNTLWVILTLTAFAILINLSWWQLNRATEKTAQLARVAELQAAGALQPSQLSRLAASDIDAAPLQGQGRWLAPYIWLLDNQIVDGKVGFTGGVGIAPQWTGRAQDPAHWRDTHFQVEGPAVAQMQSVFIDNWIKVTGDVLHGPDYFPALAPAGPAFAQMFSSSPSGGSESMQLMYLLAITAASRSIDLSAAYFVPDELTLQALTEALKRGVKLRIVVPGEHIDSDAVRNASRATWGPLLKAGATIAEYEPTMYHCKLMIVDGLLTSVGSTNFDNRSFRLNDEATLNIVDRAFASAQTTTFEADLALARPVTHAQWLARPVSERFGEWLASVMGTQL